MHRFLRSLRNVLGFGADGAKAAVLPPEEFTRVFAAALATAAPQIQVDVVGSLELRLTDAEGRESTSFLDNAYDLYKQDPGAKARVIEAFIAATRETLRGIRDQVDRDRIVPVIKDRAWLEESRRAMAARGAKDVQEFVFDDFDATKHLVIVYAEDSPKNIRYLTPENLRAANLPRDLLRSLAAENLKRLLPSVELHGADGLYMLTAGGNYEASLLVLEGIWSGGQLDVRGDIVVAVPARDLLLITGSEDRPNIEKIHAMVQQTLSGGSYRLTDGLFVYRQGRFEEFESPDGPEFSLN